MKWELAGDRFYGMTGKRIFVRGLPKETTEESLASRFAGFGFVSNVSIARDGFAGKECRGFGHLTIDIDDGAWKKCMSLLNGSKWKGMKIQISEAKPRYNDIMKTGDENPVQKPLRRLVRHASDMTLVNDDDSKKRKVDRQHVPDFYLSSYYRDGGGVSSDDL
jgi:RNA recognition motif-containing protein